MQNPEKNIFDEGYHFVKQICRNFHNLIISGQLR